jgi:hypothetical protein
MELMNSTIELESLLIIESATGFLVGSYAGDTVEVLRTETGFECSCFIARVSDDGMCEHTRAVLDYMAHVPGENIRPNLCQADADYYLSKLAALDDVQTENQLSMAQQKSRIDQWFESESAKIQRKKDYYILALDNWMHLAGYTTKSLVNGVCKVRAQQPDISITDETVILKDGRFTRTIPEKQAVDKTALRKHVLATGEEPDGVQVTTRPHKFSYSLTGKEGL